MFGDPPLQTKNFGLVWPSLHAPFKPIFWDRRGILGLIPIDHGEVHDDKQIRGTKWDMLKPLKKIYFNYTSWRFFISTSINIVAISSMDVFLLNRDCNHPSMVNPLRHPAHTSSSWVILSTTDRSWPRGPWPYKNKDLIWQKWGINISNVSHWNLWKKHVLPSFKNQFMRTYKKYMYIYKYQYVYIYIYTPAGPKRCSKTGSFVKVVRWFWSLKFPQKHENLDPLGG